MPVREQKRNTERTFYGVSCVMRFVALLSEPIHTLRNVALASHILSHSGALSRISLISCPSAAFYLPLSIFHYCVLSPCQRCCQLLNCYLGSLCILFSVTRAATLLSAFPLPYVVSFCSSSFQAMHSTGSHTFFHYVSSSLEYRFCSHICEIFALAPSLSLSYPYLSTAFFSVLAFALVVLICICLHRY